MTRRLALPRAPWSHRLSGDGRPAMHVAVVVALGFLLIQAGEVTVSDGADMLAVAHSLLHHGSAAVGPQYGVLGDGGHYYAKYGLGLSIVVLPFLMVADCLALFIGHQANLESFMASSAMPIITGLLAGALWRTSRRLGATPRWAVVIALGGVCGTYALPYGKDFFSEPLVALALVLSLDQLLARRHLIAGLALALAILTRPEAAVLLAVVPLVIWAVRGFRSALLFGAGGAVGAVIEGAYNQARFGSPLNSGYHGESFSTPFLHGSSGLLLNPQKSLLLFAPIVLVMIPAAARLWRTHRWVVVLAGSNFVAFFVMAALWHSWQGGWSWGPRLVLPGLMAALPLLSQASRKQRRIAIGLFAAGFAVSASNILVSTEAQLLDHPVPTDGPRVVRQYALIPSVASYSAHHLRAVHTPGAHSKYLALWQVNLGREFGLKGLLFGLLGSIVLLAALIAVIRRSTLLSIRRGSSFAWGVDSIERAAP